MIVSNSLSLNANDQIYVAGRDLEVFNIHKKFEAGCKALRNSYWV